MVLAANSGCSRIKRIDTIRLGNIKKVIYMDDFERNDKIVFRFRTKQKKFIFFKYLEILLCSAIGLIR